MKKFKKFTIPFIALAVLFLSACAVIAKTPLAKENEVHEKLLAGDWQVLDDASKDIQVYMIRDKGKHYSIRCRKNGVLEKEQVNFALVKLNGQYFAGFPLDKKAYIVFKIDVTEKTMTFYTLSKEILPEYSKISDKDSVATVSIGELRKWCADHVKDFSQPAFKFKRISAIETPAPATVKAPVPEVKVPAAVKAPTPAVKKVSNCIEYSVPCLTVWGYGSHGKISYLPLKFTRTGENKPRRVMIADDTPLKA